MNNDDARRVHAFLENSWQVLVGKTGMYRFPSAIFVTLDEFRHEGKGRVQASFKWLSCFCPITSQKWPNFTSSTFVKINVNE
jgi:hypothetical protein